MKIVQILYFIVCLWILNIVVNSFFVQTKEDEVINVIENMKNAKSINELQKVSDDARWIAQKQHENFEVANQVADNVQGITDDFVKSQGDYRLNDIPDSCTFNSIQDIYWACKSNPKCKGFNTINGKPGCLKNKLANKSEDPQYNFYKKKRKPKYKFFVGDYGGNEFNCGEYKSIEEIRRACDKNEKCKGFNLRNSTPLCLKSKLENKNALNDYTMYVKHAPT
jgi:hypothetical protein